MLAGIGRTESKILPGIAAAPPATIKTTIVSPTTLAMPSITAVEIPDRADGMITCVMVSNLMAPRAYDASLNSRGTAYKASSERLEIVGMAIIAKIMDALIMFK